MRTEVRPTNNASAFQLAVGEAAEVLSGGGIVALPTETVYGLAADALNPTAVARVFEAKARPHFDPLICHLPDQGWLEKMASIPADCEALANALIKKFWPGPLTLVLRRQPIVPDLVTAGLETVALRMSAHPVFMAVVKAVGRPLAAPSANRFGRISPTSAAHVVSELSGRIPLVIDGGPPLFGLESTIVAVEADGLRLLRSGPVTPEELEVFAPVQRAHVASNRPEAPGQLASHYAPHTRLIIEGEGATPDAGRIGYLAWQEAPAGRFAAVETLSARANLLEAASTLFAKMRRLDEKSLDLIVAQPVPEHGLGIAIMDRLRRAAAVKE
jgi:L-threonylcarbamoyladenylate synthase